MERKYDLISILLEQQKSYKNNDNSENNAIINTIPCLYNLS